MKKILIITGIATSLQFANAQKSISNETPDRFFIQGKEMFLNNNYIGAENTLYEFKKHTKDKNLAIEADYMIAASSYFRGKEDAAGLLREYLDSYPETYHRNEICFYLGSCYFEQKDWNKAAYWFDQTDVNYLSLNDQEDFTFRSAFTNLQQSKRELAKSQFDLLTRNSNKYFESATYYKAYIDFHEGRHAQAISIFERLKNNPEYKEQSLFFITQGLFLQNDLGKTINAGNDYLRSFPNNKNTAEIYRILGNSYYRLDDLQQSISSYERYLALEDKPFREDMYQLGVAYTKGRNYQQAIKALQFAASTENALGQAAYMLLGQNYLSLNDNTNALMAFEAASRVKYNPQISEAALYNYALLVHKTSLSVFDQSVTALQRFLREYPNSKYTNEINNQLAAAFLSTKNYQAALNAINQISSPSQQVLKAKQTILFQLGAENFINSNYQAAIQNFNACINMPDYDATSKNQAYFWRGETEYRLEEYNDALRDYKLFLNGANRSSDNYATALYNLGYSHFNLKQYNNALDYFKQYTNNEKNKQSLTYSDALNRIGDCYLFNRNFIESMRFYSSAAQGNSQSAEYAEFQKAFVLGLQRNYNGKIAALDDMMRKYPNSQYYSDALFEKSRALVILNREQDAIPVLANLLNNYPNSSVAPQAGVLLGQSHYNINNTDKAIQTYKNVVKSYKNTEEARIAIQSLEGIYRDINDIASYADFANSLGGDMIITASRQDSLTYLAAENVAMKGDYNETATAMNKYLLSYPNGQFAGDAHFQLGSAAYGKKDFETALKAFNNTINTNNSRNLDKALASVGEIQLSKGNTQEAYDAYKQLDRIATNSADRNIAQIGILQTANHLRNNDEVITIATQLLANDKTSPEVTNQAYLYRAKAYLNLGETNKAIADLSKIANDTRNAYGAEAQYMLADIYFKAKEYDKAEQQVQSFTKLGTPHAYWMARALIVLVDVYAAKGDNFQAKQYLESLQANYTGNEADITSMIQERLAKLNK